MHRGSKPRFRRSGWRRWAFRGILLLFLFLLAETTGYVGLRLLDRRYAMDPMAEITPQRVRSFLERRYHPVYGWGPNASRGDINSIGARSHHEYRHDLGATISVYGDSYTFGTGLAVEDCWPMQLERKINRPVLNFAVEGFGVDQALLRLEENYHRAPSSTVLLCMQVENINRCVGIYRGFYQAGFAPPKPRFVVEGGDVALVNPFNTPEAVQDILIDHPQRLWKLADQYDVWYRQIKLFGRPWSIRFPYSFQLSARLPLLIERLKIAATDVPLHARLYADPEALAVVTGIIRRFRRFADQQRFRGLVVVLPTIRDVRVLGATGKVPYQPLRDFLDESRIPYVDLASALIGDHRLDQLYIDGKDHFTSLGGDVVSNEVRDFLYEENAVPAPRNNRMHEPRMTLR